MIGRRSIAAVALGALLTLPCGCAQEMKKALKETEGIGGEIMGIESIQRGEALKARLRGLQVQRNERLEQFDKVVNRGRGSLER